MSGALLVAREGRVPLVLVLLAVFALAYVDVAAKIALDRAVAVFGPGLTADAATMPSRNDAIAAPATRPLKDVCFLGVRCASSSGIVLYVVIACERTNGSQQSFARARSIRASF